MPANTSSLVSLTAHNVSVERGDQHVLVDVSFTLNERSRLAIVGPNGIGKSTLLAVLAGEVTPTAGQLAKVPPSASVGFVRQELDRSPTETGHAFLARRLGIAEADDAFIAATEALADGSPGADDRYNDALSQWLALGVADFAARAEAVGEELGLPAAVLAQPTASLSGGQASRLGLAVVLLSRFDITLLDEPTNDLDLEGLAVLERWVNGHQGGIALVSHDRAFLERTVASVLEIDEHAHTARLFTGGWDAFVAEKATARRHAEQDYATYIAERSRLAGRAQQQREWSQQGLSRAKKGGETDKYVRAFNVNQTEKLAGKAKATERALERLDTKGKVDKPWEGWDLRFTIATAERSADVVATFSGAVIERGEFRIGPIDEEIRWAERVAITGANGAGKSTLIEALLGRIPLSSGIARLGSSVVVGELAQNRKQFDVSDGGASRTLQRAFEDESGLVVSDVRSVLAKFGLDADAVQRPAGSLSPGERTRAQLALFQAKGVNLLVLDEPTNHLDLPAIEQVESALSSFAGTLLLVSHDRRFVENIAITREIVLGAP